jgi:hypothetical protein
MHFTGNVFVMRATTAQSRPFDHCNIFSSSLGCPVKETSRKAKILGIDILLGELYHGDICTLDTKVTVKIIAVLHDLLNGHIRVVIETPTCYFPGGGMRKIPRHL